MFVIGVIEAVVGSSEGGIVKILERDRRVFGELAMTFSTNRSASAANMSKFSLSKVFRFGFFAFRLDKASRMLILARL